MRKFFLTRVIATDSDDSESEDESGSEEHSDEEMQVSVICVYACAPVQWRVVKKRRFVCVCVCVCVHCCMCVCAYTDLDAYTALQQKQVVANV
jgi:hypothetical protein